MSEQPSEAPSHPAALAVVPKVDRRVKFTKENAREMALRSAAAKRERKEELKRDKELRKEMLESRIKNAPSREEMKGAAAAVIFMLTEKLLLEEIPINNARELSNVADTFFNILRLESGQSTSNVEHLTGEEKIAMIREYQQAAQARRDALTPPA